MIRTLQFLNRYWSAHYIGNDSSIDMCSLCGNSGIIDTTNTAIAPSGVRVGRKNYCICPNGQSLREAKAALTLTSPWVEWRGGVIPVPCDAIVEYECGNLTSSGTQQADELDWRWHYNGERGDIIHYRVVQSDWIDWHGGECPVDPTIKVDIQLRSANGSRGRVARSLRWDHDRAGYEATEIVKYRISS